MAIEVYKSYQEANKRRNAKRLYWKHVEHVVAFGWCPMSPDMLLSLMKRPAGEHLNYLTFRLSKKALKLLKLLAIRLGVRSASGVVRFALCRHIARLYPDVVEHIPEAFHFQRRALDNFMVTTPPAFNANDEGETVKQVLVTWRLWNVCRYLRDVEGQPYSETVRVALRALLDDVGWGELRDVM